MERAATDTQNERTTDNGDKGKIINNKLMIRTRCFIFKEWRIVGECIRAYDGTESDKMSMEEKLAPRDTHPNSPPTSIKERVV